MPKNIKKKSENTKKKNVFNQFETKPEKKTPKKTPSKDDNRGIFEREREILKKQTTPKKKKKVKEEEPGSLTNLMRKRAKKPSEV